LPRKPDPSALTREDREALRLIRSSRRQQAAESRLKQAMTRALLDLQAKLNLPAKPSGDR